MLHEVSGKPFHRIGWAFLDQRRHAVQEDRYDSLIEVSTDRQRLKVQPVLYHVKIFLGFLNFSDGFCMMELE